MAFVRGLIAAGVRNPVFANLLMVCLLVGGYFSATSRQREVYPEFSLDIISVQMVYPGASAADVETSICGPIEQVLADLDGVEELTSAADAGVGKVWFPLWHTGRDPRTVVQEVKDRVDQITTFPPEAEKPVVMEEAVRTDVIHIAIFGDVGERSLRQYARDVRRDLLARPEISQVTLSGVRDEEISIELSEEALRAYELSFDEVMAVVTRGSLDLPAGTLKTPQEELTLRVAGQRLSATEFEKLVVIERPDALVRLGQIATVREGFADAAVGGRFDGLPAVLVSVFKTPGQDTLAIAALVREYVSTRQVQLPPGLHLSIWGDNSKDVQERAGLLVENGAMGLVLVFLILWMFLQGRVAFWVAAGMPVSFAGALVVMWAHGDTINMVTLFALIMVSGIIVDDAIVIAESIHSRRQAGATPELASIEGAQRVALPVLGSSLTTVIAFLPLMYVHGTMGKFIYALPVVVIAAIAASAIEAFGILPAHLCERHRAGEVFVEKPPHRVRQAIDRAIRHAITRWYRPIYRVAIRYRVVTVAAATGCAVVAFGWIAGGRTAFVLFPKENGDLLRTRVRFPEGTPAWVTADAIKRIEAAALAMNDDPQLEVTTPGALVRHVYSIAGEYADYLAVRGDNVAEVRIELMPAELRHLDDDLLIARWRAHIGPLPDALHFSVARHQLRPAGDPIEIRLLGSDFDELEEAAQQVVARVNEYDGVADAHVDLVPGKRELRIKLKPQARALGLTLGEVATQLRQGFLGGEALKLQRGGEEVVVRVRYPEHERLTVADLEEKTFRTVRGDEIPFREAVQVRWERSYASILHQDSQRRVRVFADVDERSANAEQILAELSAEFLPGVVSQYHDMRFALGGTHQQMTESVDSLMAGFRVAVIAMFAVLAGLLRSYVQPLVIVVAVPFGLIGAIAGHALLGYDLTIMSLFGAVALSGVVVNDALVLLDEVNRGVGEGMPVPQAVLAAGESRFRAVVLTSVTTLAGLTPILLERSHQAQAVIPMAISLVFGLAFATAITLLLVPALYMLMNDLRRWLRWLRVGGAYPAAEWVEEAYAQREAESTPSP